MLTDTEWATVEDIVSILAPFDKYTKKLQSETVTLSDFFGFWLSLRIKTSKRTDELSTELIKQMNFWHEKLTENPAIVAAVYLDPRYQRATGEFKQLAIDFLVRLHFKQKRIESRGMNEQGDDEPGGSNINENSDNSLDEIEEYLSAYSSTCFTNSTSNVDCIGEEEEELRIREILEDFYGQKEQLSVNILDYWNNHRNKWPELYKLASVVFAIPPTQTTVERAFSSLVLILTARRTRLHGDILQNILLVRLNSKLFKKK